MRNENIGADVTGLGTITSDSALTFYQPLIIDAAGGALSGAGAISPDVPYTNWTTTGADAGTLADGDHYGQLTTVTLVVDGGDGTLTPTTLADGTTITFADVGDQVTLCYGSSGWRIINKCNVASGDAGPVVA